MNDFVIQQGDQYALLFQVILVVDGQETDVTPNTADDVRIKVADRLCAYSDGSLTFDDEKQCWLYWLSEEQTRAMIGVVPYQVGVKRGNAFDYSQNESIDVGHSIITEVWDD